MFRLFIGAPPFGVGMLVLIKVTNKTTVENGNVWTLKKKYIYVQVLVVENQAFTVSDFLETTAQANRWKSQSFLWPFLQVVTILPQGVNDFNLC